MQVTLNLFWNLIQNVCIVINFTCYLALKNHGFAFKNANIGDMVYVGANIEKVRTSYVWTNFLFFYFICYL